MHRTSSSGPVKCALRDRMQCDTAWGGVRLMVVCGPRVWQLVGRNVVSCGRGPFAEWGVYRFKTSNPEQIKNECTNIWRQKN